MSDLILVRHGQTDWNLAGRFQGHADPPLNATGRQQATDLAAQLADTRLVAAYSSDLRRAHETAQIIATRQGLQVATDPRLREVNQGAWEGRQQAEIVTAFPEAWAARLSDPLHARSPGGESVAEVAERMRAAVNDIVRANPEGWVLVVSHSLSLSCLLCLAQNRPLAEARQQSLGNAIPHHITWMGD